MKKLLAALLLLTSVSSFSKAPLNIKNQNNNEECTTEVMNDYEVTLDEAEEVCRKNKNNTYAIRECGREYSNVLTEIWDNPSMHREQFNHYESRLKKLSTICGEVLD